MGVYAVYGAGFAVLLAVGESVILLHPLFLQH